MSKKKGIIIKRGSTVILKNGKGKIGNGHVCTVTKIQGDSIWLSASFMCGRTHKFNMSQVTPYQRHTG